MPEANIAGGLAGGILIGLASLLLLAGSGRIAGISGILGGIYGRWTDAERRWRVIFLLGLVGGAGLVALVQDGLNVRLQAEGWPLVAAGLLVGFGTRMGGGCTSGHGVCGLARRSTRSFVATLVFIGAAMLTVYILRHLA